MKIVFNFVILVSTFSKLVPSKYFKLFFFLFWILLFTSIYLVFKVMANQVKDEEYLV